MSAKAEKERRRRAGVGESALRAARLFTRNFWLKALALALAITIYATLQEEAEVEAETAAAPWSTKPQHDDTKDRTAPDDRAQDANRTGGNGTKR